MARFRGIALDIGATNIAAALVAEDGAAVLTAETANLQAHESADLIGRTGGDYAFLRALLLQSANTAVEMLCDSAGISPEDLPVSAVGNTPMSCFFAGEPVESFGHTPYTAPSLFGEEREIEGFVCRGAYIAPCFGAFVGGDVAAGLLTVPFPRKGGMLYIDAGTNGEVYGRLGGKALVCSAAAGPALEAGISGSGGENAVAANSARRGEDGEIELVAEGGKAPARLSGSGFISLMSLLIGRECAPNGHLRGGALRLGEGLRLTDADVTAFQLAKAAIAAAVLCVTRALGAEGSAYARIYLAGAVGNAASEDAMLRTGLLPPFAKGKTKPVGNAALKGASLLLDEKFRRKALALTQNTRVLPLDKSEYFKSRFAEELFFDE